MDCSYGGIPYHRLLDAAEVFEQLQHRAERVVAAVCCGVRWIFLAGIGSAAVVVA